LPLHDGKIRGLPHHAARDGFQYQNVCSTVLSDGAAYIAVPFKISNLEKIAYFYIFGPF